MEGSKDSRGTILVKSADAGKSRNTLSTIAFVLSLLFFNLIAAILGHIALGQIKKTPKSGRGLAISAVVIGWTQTFLVIFFPYEVGQFLGTILGPLAYGLGYLWGMIQDVSLSGSGSTVL
jgi:hypothetical protein